MVCPKCTTQCIQYQGIGAGQSDVDYYDTAELKQCPDCKTVYLEYYATFSLEDDVLDHIGRMKNSIYSLVAKYLEKVEKVLDK